MNRATNVYRIVLISCLALAVGCAKDPVHRVYQYRAAYVLAEDAIILAHKQGKIDDSEFARTKPFVLSAREMLDVAEQEARSGSTVKETLWQSLKVAIRNLTDIAAALKGKT